MEVGCQWCYALLVVQARNDDDKDEMYAKESMNVVTGTQCTV